jgi:DNA modification methylase
MTTIKLCGDVLDPSILAQVPNNIKCIISDPPYFINVRSHVDGKKMDWDIAKKQSEAVNWYMEWTKAYAEKLCDGGSMYVWGGIGKPGSRVFFEYASRVEIETGLKIQTMITWKKKRAYGTATNYLFVREEILFMIKGEKPITFNVPYLEKLRGYEGYNKKYPAKDARLRRTCVWDDVSELFKNKTHVAEKPVKLSEIMLSVSSNEGDTILDLFSGSGSTRKAAEKLNRNVISIEKDPDLLK